MKKEKEILSLTGEALKAPFPSIKAVKPYGSRILIEVLKPDEVLNTSLYIQSDAQQPDSAPQAYIVEIGDQCPPELVVGQRIYWEGKATPVMDPRAKNGRFRALLDVHNIKALITEE